MDLPISSHTFPLLLLLSISTAFLWIFANFIILIKQGKSGKQFQSTTCKKPLRRLKCCLYKQFHLAPAGSFPSTPELSLQTTVKRHLLGCELTTTDNIFSGQTKLWWATKHCEDAIGLSISSISFSDNSDSTHTSTHPTRSWSPIYRRWRTHSLYNL